MIRNFKRLNQFLDYKHFKMESLQNVFKLIRPRVYNESIDLKTAFYSVPAQKDRQVYLTFFYKRIFGIRIYAKWIWTSHANIYKNFKNTIFYS